MKNKPKFTFTKELFIEIIDAIEKQRRYDEKCSDAFKTILPHDHISCYDNSLLQTQLINILKLATGDSTDGLIDYYIWELDFGRKWKTGCVKIKNKSVKLKTADDLWTVFNELDKK